MSHSPGPWRWKNGPFGTSELFDAEGGPVGVEASDTINHDANDYLRPEDAAIIARAPEMASMLRELEWSGSPAGNECPVCGNMCTRTYNVPGDPIPGKPGFVTYTGRTKTVEGGHTPDCRLAALLRDLP